MIDAGGFIAEIHVGEAFDDDTSPEVKYTISDHLGSSVVVVSDEGTWFNREEYTPYGETSFGSFARKKYRFTGKPRDEESGLSYHGARYYAPWLTRWTSCDPIGPVDSLQQYCYCQNSPFVAVDSTGFEASSCPASEQNASGCCGSLATENGKCTDGTTNVGIINHLDYQGEGLWTTHTTTDSGETIAINQHLLFRNGKPLTEANLDAEYASARRGMWDEFKETLVRTPTILAMAAGPIQGPLEFIRMNHQLDPVVEKLTTPNESRDASYETGRSAMMAAMFAGDIITPKMPHIPLPKRNAYSVLFSHELTFAEGERHISVSVARLFHRVKAEEDFASWVAANPKLGAELKSIAKKTEAVWHHAFDSKLNKYSMELVPKAQHIDRELQHLLHPHGEGGFARLKRIYRYFMN